MKLVDGQTLAALLESREESGNDRGELLRIFQHVCETIAYAHSRSVIHRDLKPANVMVGAFGEVQVMDWGLAKVLSESDTDDEMNSTDEQSQQRAIGTLPKTDSHVEGATGSDTRVGSVMGTFSYMPPEQALGEVDRLDERTDVFALGAILSEILTGKPPYFAETNRDLRHMATSGNLDECFARLDACEAELEITALAKSCLSPKLEDRPRNASVVATKCTEFHNSLEKRLKDAELEELASEARANEERRRRKLYVGICLILASFGVAALIAAGNFRSLYIEKEQESQNTEKQRRRADHEANEAKVRWLSTESRALQLEH